MLTECPQSVQLTTDVLDAIAAAGMAESGSWPVAGGWADQSATLVRAVRVVWDERAAVQAAEKR